MNTNEMKEKKVAEKKKNRKFGCFGSDYEHPTIDKSDCQGNIVVESDGGNTNHGPTHLVVMVNGMNGSAQNWRFVTKQFLKKFPEDLIIHRSDCNPLISTYDGVDVMGSRLADEVVSVIKRHTNLQKISFIGHSLGGLVARYAIAKLYSQEFTRQDGQENEEYASKITSNSFSRCRWKGKIAGLEPVNFITLACPHLGVRAHRQVPMLCGVYALEGLASHLSWFLKRSGKHVFLTDGNHGQPPLLLQMVSDHKDLKFLSALWSFKRRVVYANVHFDIVVGWSTSSIRRPSELRKDRHLPENGKYPHILKMQITEENDFAQEGAARVRVKRHNIADMEETMIRALTTLSWERVDVSFKGSRLRYFAHNMIQVKRPWISTDGADIVQHMADHFHL